MRRNVNVKSIINVKDENIAIKNMVITEEDFGKALKKCKLGKKTF